MILRSGIQPIGLDIGHDSVKMLQLEVVDQALSVRRAAQQRMTPGAAAQGLEAALKVAVELLKRGGFAGRSVIAALPHQIVHVKNVRLPLMPAAELPAAVGYEARNIFPFDADAAHVDYICAGEVRQGTEARQEVIVLAARHCDVDEFVDRLDRAGLTISSLDAEPCALYRVVERFIRRREDEHEVNVLLDMGLRRTQVLIGRGREMSFFKPIEIGGQRLNDAVWQRLGIAPDEAQALRRRMGETAAKSGETGGDSVRQAVFHATRGLLEELGREIGLCLRYHSVTFRGPGPTRVRLVGGEAHDANVRGVLGVALSLPVEAAQPLFNVNCPAGISWGDGEGSHSQWALALGLGLRHLSGKIAARDGRRRLTRAAVGEVVDLNQAVASEPREAAGPAEVSRA